MMSKGTLIQMIDDFFKSRGKTIFPFLLGLENLEKDLIRLLACYPPGSQEQELISKICFHPSLGIPLITTKGLFAAVAAVLLFVSIPL
jgi:hypothetical protein